MFPMHRGSRASGHSSQEPAYRGHEQLEEDNALREDELKGKIGALKSLTIDIGGEIREHNRILAETDGQFDSVYATLGHSVQRVLGLAKSGSRYVIWGGQMEENDTSLHR